MLLAVSLVGVLMLGVGLAVLVSPAWIRRAFDTMVSARTLPLLALIRVGLGVILVIAAADTRLPLFVWAFGLLLIVAGVSLPILGIRRVLKMTEWWKAQSDGSYRSWALLAVLLGALLIWAAA